MLAQKHSTQLKLQINYLFHHTWDQDAKVILPFHTLTLKKIIEKLKTKASSGPDGHSSKLLKAINHV